MLVIRLSRTGRNKYPTYRIVAADSKRAATGKFVMILGHYNPHTKELVIKRDETASYIKNGAQPSNAVIKLMKQEKVDLPEWVVLKTRNRKAKKEVAPVEVAASAAAEPEASAEPVANDAGETPASAPEAVTEVAAAEVETVSANAESANITETAASEEAAKDKTKAANEAAVSTSDDKPEAA